MSNFLVHGQKKLANGRPWDFIGSPPTLLQLLERALYPAKRPKTQKQFSTPKIFLDGSSFRERGASSINKCVENDEISFALDPLASWQFKYVLYVGTVDPF